MAKATNSGRDDTDIVMEARSEPELPQGPGWWYEPKWDGFRCLAAKDASGVSLTAKSGKSLTRYFPEGVDRLAALAPARFVVDGELLIGGEGAFSFEALQM